MLSGRSRLLMAAAAAGLAGPTVLSFFSGGYFGPARAWAGAVAWALVAVAAVTGLRLPPGRPARLALAALAGFAAWTLLSILWAPVAGAAYAAGQIAVVYLGALLAAALLLADPRRRRLAVPVLAGGALVVIGYGLSERLLPGALHFTRSVSAEGRLEQPLTYWNAMGELAAIGFVLAASLAGDPSRSPALRRVAVAAAAPLGLGLYISFSRGALFACVAGLLALVVAARTTTQLVATVVSVLAGAAAALAAAPSHGVTGLAGSLAARERAGAITLAALVVIAAAAAAAHYVADRRVAPRPLSLPRRAPLIATCMVAAGLAAAILLGAKETSGAPLSGGASRLVTLQSNRYDYWDVALRAFATSPFHGVGAGGWQVYWLRWRTVNEFAQNAHSLELETLAELGDVGVALLLVLFGAVGVSARDALAADRAVAAGPVAGLVVYLAHSPLDWDWQMPAVTLVAVALAGLLLTAPRRPAAPRG